MRVSDWIRGSSVDGSWAVRPGSDRVSRVSDSSRSCRALVALVTCASLRAPARTRTLRRSDPGRSHAVSASSRSSRPSPRCCSRSAPAAGRGGQQLRPVIRPRSRSCRESARCSIPTSSGSCRCGRIWSWSTAARRTCARSSSARIPVYSLPATPGWPTSRRRSGRSATASAASARAPRSWRRRSSAHLRAIRKRVAGRPRPQTLLRLRPRARRAARHLRERRHRLHPRHAGGGGRRRMSSPT